MQHACVHDQSPLICSIVTQAILGGMVVSIPVCHTGDRGSIPCQGVSIFWSLYFSPCEVFCNVTAVTQIFKEYLLK